MTALVVRDPNTGATRRLTGAELRELVQVLEAIEGSARTLERRGVGLREFLGQRSATDGRLPVLRAEVFRPGSTGPATVFLYDDEGLDRLREEEQQQHGPVEVIEYSHLVETEGNGNGDNEGPLPAHRIVRHELGEGRLLQPLLERLEAWGLGSEDLFGCREELVTGERQPAKFALQFAEETVEIDNLRGLGAAVCEIGGRGYAIKRFKGLGEMNPEELWATTMDPGRRNLLRVRISTEADDPDQQAHDVRAAERIFSILMGDDVESRRKFIEGNAIHVKNLDV
jgi:DNA gyrase subunit B